MQRGGHGHIAVGLDIGTSKISTCVGMLQDGVPTILALTRSPSAGIRKGVISDIEEAISAVSASLANTERMAGMQLTSAIVGLEGSHITTTHSKGIVAVNRGTSEISVEDTSRAIEAARAVALPPNQEILHVLPKLFSVDGLEGVKDPIGMMGIRLEVETYIIGASSAAIRNLGRVITSAGLKLDDLVFSPLAAASAVLDGPQKENGVVVIDFGAATTSIIVYEEGDIIHATVIPIGSSHITNDIAIGLRTNLEIAERIKQDYAYAQAHFIGEDETIELAEFDPTEAATTSRKYICEIVEARLNEVFSLVREELRTINRDGMLPAGAILIGGGSRLSGIVEAAKDMLQLPAQMGTPPSNMSGMIDAIDDPLYTTAIGLMLMGLHHSAQPPRPIQLGKLDHQIGGLFDKAKGLFKHLLP